MLSARQWPHLTPRPFSLILWILCVAMGFALAVMAIWQVSLRLRLQPIQLLDVLSDMLYLYLQLWLVSQNETAVEANDNCT